MMQRNDSRRKEIESMMAICTNGDALNKEQVAKIFNSELPFACLHDFLFGARFYGYPRQWRRRQQESRS